MEITYDTANSAEDLHQILALQQSNLRGNINKNEAATQGFVSLTHTYDLLKQMSHPYPHIVARHDGQVIAYALIMLREMAPWIPELEDLFTHISESTYRGKCPDDASYFVMGQICVHKAFRGMGVVQKMYQTMAERMHAHFDYVITDISAMNPRSLKAHEKVGFETLAEYQTETGDPWVIVIKDLKNEIDF